MQDTSNEIKRKRQMKCQLRQEGNRLSFKASISQVHDFVTIVCWHT